MAGRGPSAAGGRLTPGAGVGPVAAGGQEVSLGAEFSPAGAASPRPCEEEASSPGLPFHRNAHPELWSTGDNFPWQPPSLDLHLGPHPEFD